MEQQLLTFLLCSRLVLVLHNNSIENALLDQNVWRKNLNWHKDQQSQGEERVFLDKKCVQNSRTKEFFILENFPKKESFKLNPL